MSNDLNVPKMWPEKQILPMYFQTVEKYFESRNVVDENLRFVAITNNMTTEQLSKHSLSLSTAAQSDQPYTALKNSILTAVADDSKTNWIDVLCEIRYSSSTEKPSSLMARMISTCRMNPEQDQGTRDLVERTFIQLHSENIQNILKAQNFDILHDLGNFANQYHNQINCGHFCNTASTKNEITQLSNKINELAVELKHEKDQRRHHLDFVPARHTPTRNAPFFKPSTTSRYKQSYFRNGRIPRDHIKTRFPDSLTGFCFFHSKFGKRANKCSNPCTFQKNQTKSINTIDPPEKNIPFSKRHVYQKFAIKFLVCCSYLTLVLVRTSCLYVTSIPTKKRQTFNFSLQMVLR